MWALLAFTIGTNLPSPLYPLYQVQFHMNEAAISLLFATYAVFLVPSLLLVGPLSDQTGRKLIIIPNIIVMTLASLLFVYASSEYILFIARALQGIATGSFLGTCNAFMLDHSRKKYQTTTLLLASFFTMLGFGLGPGLAGFTLQYFKWFPEQSPFLLHIILMIIALSFVLTVKETVSFHPPIRFHVAIGVPAKLRRPMWTFIAPSGFIFFAFNGSVIALFPSFTKNILHINNFAVSGGLLLLLMLTGGLAQLLVRHRSMTAITKWGLILSTIGAFIMISAAPMESIIVLILGTIIEGVGNGWTFKGSLALAGQISTPDIRAQIMSTYYIAAYAGFIIPVFAVGELAVFTGLSAAMFLLSVVLTIAVLIIIFASHSGLTQKYNKAS